MSNTSTNSTALQSAAETAAHLLDDWFDPIEAGLRDRVHEFIQIMIEGELDAALSRLRYARRPKEASRVPMARAVSLATGTATDHGRCWGPSAGSRSPCRGQARHRRGQDNRVEEHGAAGAYQRRTKPADALIAGAYLAGTNTRRVRRALSAVFGGAVGKDTVSRVWRKVKGDWDAWNARSLAEEPIIRMILDGTVVRVRLDRKATSIVLLVVLGVREDGQKVLLAVKNMGGETSHAWRAVLDDLVRRGLHKPEFLIVDGGSGLEQALDFPRGDVPTQRCTVHKHRNLCAHAPQRLHEEVSADYTDMISAASPAEIEARRRAFIRKWRLKCKAVADSLEEADDRLQFTRLPLRKRRSSGRARAPPMRSNGSMRNSSAGSRPRRCCLRPKPQPCCSGRCSPPVRSQCAKSTGGRP